MMRPAIASSVTALMLGAAPSAWADDWSTLVIGTDALAVSNSLSAAGVQDVRHLLEGDPRAIADAVVTMGGAERVMIFFNGALSARAGQPAIGDDPRLTMAALADTLAAGGARQVAILLENCGVDGKGVDPAAPIGSLRADLLLAASAAPGAACSGRVLSDAIAAASLSTPLQDIVSAGWIGVSPNSTMSLEPAAGAATTSVAFIEPRGAGQAIGATPTGDEVQTALFIAPPASQIAAIPVPAGFPQPSITVGVIEVAAVPQETETETVEAPEDVVAETSEIDVSWDSLETRVALRDSDPDLFGTLLQGGALDPPTAELASAIQTELKRMNCYRSVIDGDFGPGSRRGVTEYYDERDLGTPASTDPTVDLWREIISNEDVACPTPVVQAPRPQSNSNSGGGTRTTTAAPARPAPAPAPAPAAPQSSGTRTITGSGGGLGVFR